MTTVRVRGVGTVSGTLAKDVVVGTVVRMSYGIKKTISSIERVNQYFIKFIFDDGTDFDYNNQDLVATGSVIPAPTMFWMPAPSIQPLQVAPVPVVEVPSIKPPVVVPVIVEESPISTTPTPTIVVPPPPSVAPTTPTSTRPQLFDF